MSDTHDNPPPPPPQEATASDELREGLSHLLSAARKVARNVEPTVSRSLEDAERMLDRVGKEGEEIVGEVSREVATFAERLAERLRAVAERDERKKQEPPPGDHGA